jgi:cephalosporin hydroxylase
VIAIDLDVATARRSIAAVDPLYDDLISLVDGDVRDPSSPDMIRELIPAEARCLVSEDSAHVYETTFSALEGFAQFVPRGGYFVVEDRCVDIEEMRSTSEWPRGVLPALRAWLSTDLGSLFVVRRDLGLYGVSCHPEGFLQRRERG